MTITNTDREVTHIGNSSTTVWQYEFRIASEAAAFVSLIDVATGDITSVDSGDYTITGIDDDDGGTVTYPTVASGDDPLTSDTEIIIFRVTPLTQPITVTNQTGYDANVVEKVWDRLTMMAQDLSSDNDRNLHFDIGDSSNPVVPAAVADTVLAIWNSDATALITGPTASSISAAETNAAAAATSATEASDSATAAAISEDNAAASASVAAAAAAGAQTAVVDLFVDSVDYTSGTSTQLTLSLGAETKDVLTITFDGLIQHQGDFSISGSPSVVTFTSVIPLGVAEIQVAYGVRAEGSGIAVEPNQYFADYHTNDGPDLDFGVLTASAPFSNEDNPDIRVDLAEDTSTTDFGVLT